MPGDAERRGAEGGGGHGGGEAGWRQGATARLFETPISLEYEKVYSPFILVSKKRYGGLKYEEEGREPSVDTKGLDLVRRDRIPLARELQGTILDLILIRARRARGRGGMPRDGGEPAGRQDRARTSSCSASS